MSIIPNDLYRCGRQTMAIERKAHALDPGAYADIIATSVGKEEGFTLGHYKFVGTSGAASAGFTTVPFDMYDETQGDLIIAAELQLDGYLPPTANIERVTFSDGTNSISVYNDSEAFDADTLYSATINGVTTTGVMIHAFNIGTNYAPSRQLGVAWNYARYNLRFRFDKNRDEFSVWLGDQLKGAVKFDNMTAFGSCTFQLIHEGYRNFARPLYIRQIGMRLEC